MLDLRIIAEGTAVPFSDLPALIGREQAAQEIGDQIEALIALMDDLRPDPDDEDNGDFEPDADRELSYPEWHTRDRHKTTAGGYEMARTADVSDDDEEDDDDACTAGDDGTGTLRDPWSGRIVWELDDGSDREIGSWPEQIDQRTLVEYQDDDREDDLPEVRRAYVRRARRPHGTKNNSFAANDL